MSDEDKSKNDSHSKSKNEREILELRIDSKLTEAKEALRAANQSELERIARTKHEPKLKRVLSSSGIIIAALIVSNLWAYLGIKERIKNEAGRIIDQKLIDPQLTNTLNEALSEKAIPFISAQVRPIETNVATLKANVNEQTKLFGAMALDVSNKQSQLTLEQTTIREQIHPLFGEIDSLRSSVDIAQKDAKRLQDEQKLTTLMNRGEVFDSDAIHELQTIAQGTNETAPLAQAMFNKIQRELVLDRGAFSSVAYNEGGKYSGPFTSDELAVYLSIMPSPELDGIVNLLGNQKLFVPKLVELAHNSKDMWTVNRIAKALNDMTGVSFYPWDLQPLDSWWAQNSMNYTNWPLEQYNKGMDAIRACQYGEALTNFEFVLRIDPTADKSRAFAVASAIEIGNMEKAQELNTNYAATDGRWKQWAQGKMMLATNAIQQGTEKFVFLTTNYPTFVGDAFIAQGNNILRQIDWTLYSKLMQPTNNVVTNKQVNLTP
jgi:TolA-binding protein